MVRMAFLFILFSHEIIVFAGEIPYRFTHLSSSEGLPHNYVFSIVQDKTGFIWIGTNNGLARYDGYNFKVYRPNPDKPQGIAKKPANYLYIDLRGNLWISYRGIGLNRMDLETERFTYYEPNNLNKYAISGNQIRKFYEDKDTLLWIATEFGIDMYNPNNERFIHVLPETIGRKTIPSNNIYNVFRDKNDYIWFLSSSGIGRFNPKSNGVFSLGKLTNQTFIDTIAITAMLYDGNDCLWFSSKKNGLFCYQISENKLSNYLKDKPNIANIYMDKAGNLYLYTDTPNYSLLYIEKKKLTTGSYSSYPIFNAPNSVSIVRFDEDKSGNVWIASYQGLEMFNPTAGITHYRSNIFSQNTLSGNEIESLFIDKTENLWVCVYRKGIDKADLKQKPFQWYLNNPVNKNSLAGNNITAICEDKNNYLWIGCSGDGLSRYDKSKNIYATIPLKSKSQINIYAFTSIYEDKEGYIWIGYYDNQLDRIDPKTLKVQHYSSEFPQESKYCFKSKGVRKISEDKFGNLWFASMNGLIEYDLKSGVFTYHSALYESNSELSNFCRTVYIDNDGIIWAGSNNGGLIKYNKNKHQFIHFLNNPKDTNSISSNTVYSICEDAKGYLWIGTSVGLNRFDKKNEKFTQITKKQYLNHYSIISILPDTLGNYWLSTDNGLVKYNTQTSECDYFYESDGLLGNEFNTTSYYQSHSGEIFLGSPKGMISFFPKNFKKNPYLPKPAITNLLIFNKSISPGDTLNKRIILKKQIWATQEIIFSYKENDFTLEFSALHYAIPEKAKYI